MHSDIYLLIAISLVAGFCMRPLNQFIFGKVASLTKYFNHKAIIILLMFVSMLTAIGVTISTIYLSLKLSGFIPLGEHTPTFVIAFFAGSMLWVIYLKLFNRDACQIDLD